MMQLQLKQWDIVKVRIYPNDRDEHLAIVLSPVEIAGNAQYHKVNVLYGTTKRPAVDIKPGQIILDGADGCEHPTVFDCIFFPVVPKDRITANVGSVCPTRRRILYKTIAEALRLYS